MAEHLNSEKSEILTVTQLNRRARLTIERQFETIWVSGELSNLSRPKSGHWYFTLKDEKAQVRCAMFANRNRSIQIQPADGQKVLLRGKVSLYEGRGDFQIIADQIEAAGEGALRQAFEQLKVKLSNEGIFATEAKKAIPKSPRHIAVISSKSGAALQDVLSVWRRRYPIVTVTIIPSIVQGQEAETALINAIDKAEEIQPDTILLTRGGGSLEDLWCFNSEALARRINKCGIPLVSAVGHEIDVTIADFVADLRAPTPSAAAEMLTPDALDLIQELKRTRQMITDRMRDEVEKRRLTMSAKRAQLIDPGSYIQQAAQRTDGLFERVSIAARSELGQTTQQLKNLEIRLKLIQPGNLVNQLHEEVASLRKRLGPSLKRIVRTQANKLDGLARTLDGVSPLPTMRRGYSIVRNNANEILKSSEQLRPSEKINLQFIDGNAIAQVESIDRSEKLNVD